MRGLHNDWTTTFFDGLAGEFWLNVAPPPDETEVEFLRGIFGNGGELLDVLCGAGRYAIPLFHASYAVTGVDISDGLLNLARQREPRIDWVLGDVRDIAWKERFSGALCYGNSFSFFPREEMPAFLRGMAEALKPGGAFVIESRDLAESLAPHLSGMLQMEQAVRAGDVALDSRARYDAARSMLEIEYTFSKADVRETKRGTRTIFTAGEVGAMLRGAGFSAVDVYASAARDPFVLGAPRAIFVARR